MPWWRCGESEIFRGDVDRVASAGPSATRDRVVLAFALDGRLAFHGDSVHASQDSYGDAPGAFPLDGTRTVNIPVGSPNFTEATVEGADWHPTAFGFRLHVKGNAYGSFSDYIQDICGQLAADGLHVRIIETGHPPFDRDETGVLLE